MSSDAATPSHEKDNFIRLSSLLVDGGTKLLREVLNECLRPDTLHAVLAKPKTKAELNKTKLYPDQKEQLYPIGGGCVTSEDFDITLLCKLLRHLCNLTPSTSDWNKLPNAAHTSQADDLVRIRIHRNEAVAHIKEMKLDDGEFQRLYVEISSAMHRLAKSISSDKECEWKIVTEQYLSGPITSRERDCVEQLNAWYENEKELKEEMRAGFDGLGRDIANLSQGMQELRKDLVGNKQGGYSDPSPRMSPDLSQKKKDCDNTRVSSKVTSKVWKVGTPTVLELDNVARNVVDCWQPLGRQLGVSQSAIDNIQYDTVNYSVPRQKAFRMLQVWSDKGRSSTYAQLGKALCNVGKEGIAEAYNQG